MFQEGKHNIERMAERVVGSRYHQLQHFISDSPWEHGPVLQAVGRDISQLLSGKGGPKGLLIDEEGHVKKGKESAGVARQYLGSVGKVDNGQVSVLAALNQADDVALVNVRLFLPEQWTKDKARCQKAGIPPASQVYKRKWELALEMIDELEGNITYDWVNADGFYGNAQGFRLGLHKRNKLFVLDIHQDQRVYLTYPAPSLPDWSGKGRKPVTYCSRQQSLQVRAIVSQLKPQDWKMYTFRQGSKGPMTRKVYTQTVYLWHPTDEQQVETYTLVISCKTDETEVKYALANDVENAFHPKLTESELLFRQMNRYWVERGIQDGKDALAMMDYQVRSWRAFHHHITLTIMALHYILIHKLNHQQELPLLSVPDIKFALAMTLPRKTSTLEQVAAAIQQRHKQRQYDINRHQT